MSHLATAVPNCHELPMMHISILSVEQNRPWTLLAPPTSTKQPASTKRSSSKDTPYPLYVDASSATYALFHSVRLPLSLIDHSSPECAPESPFIADPDDIPPSDTLPILPLSSTTLIHVPTDGGYTSISMLHIHLLHTAKSPTSSLTIPDTETHREITHNYYELMVLAAAKWRFDCNACLPLHLGALHIMYMALGRGDLEQRA
jgi:mediator of RNA polymerase II transcription subunit 13, fungi type